MSDNFSAASSLSAIASTSTAAFTLPILYKLGAYDKVLVWIISFNGTNLIMHWGTEDKLKAGTLQYSVAPVELNTSGRNLQEQALLEARSRWKRKCDKDGFSDKTIDMNVLNMPAMLANTFDPIKRQVRFPAFVQPKFDGDRARANPTEDGGVYMISRGTKVINHFDHIREDLKKLFPFITNVMLRIFPDSYPLFRTDGELYTSNIAFDQASGITRYSENRSASSKEILFNYYIFDLIISGNYTYDERLSILNEAYNECIKTNVLNYIVLVPCEIVNSNAEIVQKHNEYVSRGFEGVIIRMYGGKNEKERKQSYYLNHRCSSILKYKQFDEDEAVIVGANSATGTENGAVVWRLKAKNGKIFDCRPRGSVPSRKQLYNSYVTNEGREFLGRAYRYRYQGVSADGVPRFPVGLTEIFDRVVPGAYSTNSEIENSIPLALGQIITEIGTIIGAAAGSGDEAQQIIWMIRTLNGNSILIVPTEGVDKRKEYFVEWMRTNGATYVNKKYKYSYNGVGPNGEYKNVVGIKLVDTFVGKVVGATAIGNVLSWSIEDASYNKYSINERSTDTGMHYFSEYMKDSGATFVGRNLEYEIEDGKAYSIGFV